MSGNRKADLPVPGFDRKAFGERLRQAMEGRHTQASLAETIGVSLSGLQKWVSGGADPGWPYVVAAAEATGVSLDWLATGQGPMRLEAPACTGHHDATDPELLGRLWEGVTGVYREENQRIAPVQQARLVARMYDDLAVIEDEAERRGALRYALEQLRRDLRTAAIAPASTKRPA